MWQEMFSQSYVILFFYSDEIYLAFQGSKIALVRLILRVPQAAEQVKILIFQVKIKFFPIYANSFCDAGQVLIFRYFEPCIYRKKYNYFYFIP